MSVRIEHKWRKLLAILRERQPPIVPVRVRRIPLAKKHGVWGWSWPEFNDDGHLTSFEIRVDRDCPYHFQADTLCHEWAHCLAWPATSTMDDHSDAWGEAYAMLLRECE